MQGISKAAHQLCNWTGIASRITHHSVDTSHLDLSLTQAAFPPDMFEEDLWQSLRLYTKKFTRPGSVARFVRTNWTQVHDVDRVPVKARVDPILFPDIHLRSTDGRTGLANFYPERMSPENIGGNLGLLQLLRNEWDLHLATPAIEQKYKLIVSDCNIFLRIIKVRSLLCHVIHHHFLGSSTMWLVMSSHRVCVHVHVACCFLRKWRMMQVERQTICSFSFLLLHHHMSGLVKKQT